MVAGCTGRSRGCPDNGLGGSRGSQETGQEGRKWLHRSWALGIASHQDGVRTVCLYAGGEPGGVQGRLEEVEGGPGSMDGKLGGVEGG